MRALVRIDPGTQRRTPAYSSPMRILIIAAFTNRPFSGHPAGAPSGSLAETIRWRGHACLLRGSGPQIGACGAVWCINSTFTAPDQRLDRVPQPRPAPEVVAIGVHPFRCLPPSPDAVTDHVGVDGQAGPDRGYGRCGLGSGRLGLAAGGALDKAGFQLGGSGPG